MFIDRDAQGQGRGCKPANDADVDVDGQQITNVIIASICVSAWRVDGLMRDNASARKAMIFSSFKGRAGTKSASWKPANSKSVAT